MIKLTIYGRLRKFIGQSTFEIDVASPRQAFSFLINNFKGVGDHMKEQEYCVMAGKVRITEELLDLQTESDIKIIPVVHGEVFFLAAAFLGAGAVAGAVGGALTAGILLPLMEFSGFETKNMRSSLSREVLAMSYAIVPCGLKILALIWLQNLIGRDKNL